MSENNFEISVQREMEGFKLKPSDEVWTQVEERIRVKKKRRIFFILFFFFGLVFLGYWQRDYFFGGEIKELVQIEKKQIKSTDSSTSINEYHAAGIEEQIKNEKSVDVIDKLVLKTSDQAKETKSRLTDGNSLKPDPTIKSDNTEVIKMSVITQPQAITDVQEKKEQKEEVIVNTQTAIKKDSAILEEKKVTHPLGNPTDSVMSIPGSLPKDEKQNEDEIPQNKSENYNLKSDSSNVALQKRSSLKKWKWGFLLTPGISSFNDGVFSLNMNKSNELFASPVSSGSGSQNRPAPPSSSSAGFAFQAGAFLINQLKPRVSFSVGLQYAYYSEHLSVGARNDAILRNTSQVSALTPAIVDANYAYNASGTKKNFTNNYHFIEIPVIFQFQLNKKKSNPFNWTVGISAGQLISARTVAYDTAFGGIYYDNKESLNKTKFSLTTGFSWGIFNDKKIRGSLGPVVDFHLNSLINNELDKNKYLLFAGLRTIINFSE